MSATRTAAGTSAPASAGARGAGHASRERHSAWRAVVDAALLGAARAPVPPLPGALAALVAAAGTAGPGSGTTPSAGRDLPRDPAERLGLCLAVASRARRAGARAAPLPRGVLEPPRAPADSHPEAPTAAADRLALLLEVRRTLVPAWCEACRAAGARVPDALLPAALAAGRADPSLRPVLAGVLGGRARWLARLAPAWGWVLQDEEQEAPRDPHAWAAAAADVGLGVPERRGALEALRAVDPARGRRVLAAVAPGERAPERLLLLRSLAVALEPEDEPLLVSATSDRSAEVRGCARELLRRLPGSALRARDRLRLSDVLAPRGPRGLRVVPPPGGGREPGRRACDVADGVHGADDEDGPGQVRALLGAVHPDDVSAVLGEEPEVAAARVARAADGGGAPEEAALAGLLQAAARRGDARWAAALVPVALERQDAVCPSLLRGLPARARDALLAAHLRGGKGQGPVSAAAAAAWLSEVPGPWSAALGDAVLHHLHGQVALAAATRRPWVVRAEVDLVADRAALGTPPLVALAPTGTPPDDPVVRLLADGDRVRDLRAALRADFTAADPSPTSDDERAEAWRGPA